MIETLKRKEEFKEGPNHIAFLVHILSDPKLLSKCSHKRGKEAILLAEKRHSILFVEDYFLLLFSALSVLRPM